MNYYKQGNKEKADQIKAAFEAKGYHTGSWDYGDELFFFFSMNNGHIRAQRIPGCNKDYEACLIDIIKTHPDYKELELPKPHYDISNFHVGMPVLVRDNEGEEWRYTTFSHVTSRFYENKFAAGCTYWSQCIPFNDDTKHLLGTTEPCDEMYINW